MENSLLRVLKITSSLNGAKAIDGLMGEIASPGEPSTAGYRFGAATYQRCVLPEALRMLSLGWTLPVGRVGVFKFQAKAGLATSAASSSEIGCDGACYCLQSACPCKSYLSLV